MFPSPFLSDKKCVYWIVGAGLVQRHATEVRPGALPDGEWAPALCEVWVRIPFCTPFGREPASKKITHRCPQCTEVVAGGDFREIAWDC